VEAIEAGDAFRELFAASAKRRKLDKAFVEMVLKRSTKLDRSGTISAWEKTFEAERIAKDKVLEERKLFHERNKVSSKHPPAPPSKLVCSVDVATILDEWPVSIRFIRHEGIDRVYCDENPSMNAECESLGTTAEAVAKLLPGVLNTLIRFGGQVQFTSPGLVDERMFATVVEELNFRMGETKKANLERSDEAIVILASELGLAPEPSSESTGFWNARCPGTQHQLLLNTSRNEFWCGYCNRSGDVDGLRSFVDELSR
jgi:hypothetical protein